jgi:hypothetical protein
MSEIEKTLPDREEMERLLDAVDRGPTSLDILLQLLNIGGEITGFHSFLLEYAGRKISVEVVEKMLIVGICNFIVANMQILLTHQYRAYLTALYIAEYLDYLDILLVPADVGQVVRSLLGGDFSVRLFRVEYHLAAELRARLLNKKPTN